MAKTSIEICLIFLTPGEKASKQEKVHERKLRKGRAKEA